MKKNAFYFLAVFGLYLAGMVPFERNGVLTAQSDIRPVLETFKYADQICYREHVSERLKTETNLNTAKLTLEDKLLFRNKEQTFYHSCTLDEKQLPVRKTTYEFSHGVYPDWYQPPTYTVENEEGIKSWFNSDNQYLPGGWAGATFKETEHGFYQSDARNGGSRTYFMYHTKQSQQAYDSYAEYVSTYGFLHDIVFTVPSRETMNYLASQGFEVVESVEYIIIRNAVIKIIWKLRERTIIQEIRNENNEVTTEYTYYDFIENIGDYLKVKQITSIPIQFESGNCAEKLIECTYSDYTLDCGNETEFRIEKPGSEPESFSLHPNPAGDFITLLIPDYSGSVKIRIFNSQGVLIQSLSDSINGTLSLDTSLLTPGSYNISVIAGSLTWQSTFIKL